MGRRLKLFIAIPFSQGLRAQLVRMQERLEARVHGMRWVAPTGFHLTLKFVGDTEPEDVPGICAAAEDAAAGVEPFGFSIRSLGTFPRPDAPKVLWAGVDTSGGADVILQTVVDRLDESCAALSVPRETRGYRPHVTLARLKRKDEVDPAAVAAEIAYWDGMEVGKAFAREIHVYQSIRSPDGAAYDPIATVQLG